MKEVRATPEAIIGLLSRGTGYTRSDGAKITITDGLDGSESLDDVYLDYDGHLVLCFDGSRDGTDPAVRVKVELKAESNGTD